MSSTIRACAIVIDDDFWSFASAFADVSEPVTAFGLLVEQYQAVHAPKPVELRAASTELRGLLGLSHDA